MCVWTVLLNPFSYKPSNKNAATNSHLGAISVNP